jgi:Histidine kinase-, DNA gyrase B-, and HSP90-like ATPase
MTARSGAKTKGKGGDTFERKVFRASRLADFASIPELIKQTGQPPENWPLVILKELIDNALDEAEAAGIAPEIEVTVGEMEFTVTDRGRGMKSALVKALTDYASRSSSKAAYASPTRGAQGNAMQIVLALGYALAPEGDSRVVIESQGVKHTIRFRVDPVRQTPVVDYEKDRSAVKTGTRINVQWPSEARSLIDAAEGGFLSLLAAYSWVNPHLALKAKWRGGDIGGVGTATDPSWTKWRPNMATSAYWYDEARLSLLMASYIADAEDRRGLPMSVRDFIRLFRGLSATAKINEIAVALGVAEGETLADFFNRSGGARMLLAEMQTRSRPVKPRDLGVIGEDHLRNQMVKFGCERDSIVYKKREAEHAGLPYMIEAAFGYRGDDEQGSLVAEGFNFAPSVGGSPFDLRVLFGAANIEKDDPVVVFLHVASPRLDFLDRGKAKVALPPEINRQLTDLAIAITSKWQKQKRAEIRHADAYWRRADRMAKRDRMTIKDAAYEVMEEAYEEASGDGAGGHLPVKPRQIADSDEAARV